MSSEFDSTNNKGFLWNLMYENGMFSNISSSQVQNVKQTFDTIVSDIDKKNENMSLSEKNKQTLIVMNKQRDSFIISDIPITAADAADKRSELFNKNLKEKQKELGTYMSADKPNEINFSDKFDGPIGSEMDNMLAEAIAKREKELNVVLQKQDTKEGDNWINKDNLNEKHIKIGEQIQDKHVTFNLQETSNNEVEEPNFLSMLKKSPELKKELTINDRLRIIERNQTSTMNILSNILEILQSK